MKQKSHSASYQQLPEKKINSRAFTLIELLVVIAIIGILSSVVLVSLNSARAKGRDAARFTAIRQIQNALELYRSKYGVYPFSTDTLLDQNGNGGQGIIGCTIGSGDRNGSPTQPIDVIPDISEFYKVMHKFGTSSTWNTTNDYGCLLYGTNNTGSEYKFTALAAIEKNCPVTGALSDQSVQAGLTGDIGDNRCSITIYSPGFNSAFFEVGL